MLIGGLVERKALGKRFDIVLLELERVAFACRPDRVQVQQLGRGIAHLLGRFAPCPVPVAAAKLVQRGSVRIGARVAADQVQL